MASEDDTPETLVMQRSRQLATSKDHVNEDTNFQYVLETINEIRRKPDDDQTKTNLQVQGKYEDTDGECIFYPPSVEKVAYEDLVKNSDDFPGVSDDAKITNQNIEEELCDSEDDEENPEITKANIEHFKNLNLFEKVEEISVFVPDEQTEGSEIRQLVTEQKIKAQIKEKKTQKEDEKMTQSAVEDISILQTSSVSVDRKESTPETMVDVQELGIDTIEENQIFGEIGIYKEEASTLLLDENIEDTAGTSENIEKDAKEKYFESNINSQGETEEDINSVAGLATLLSEPEDCLTKKRSVETKIKDGGSAEDINTEADSTQVQNNDHVNSKENYQQKAVNRREIVEMQSSEETNSYSEKHEQDIDEIAVQRKDDCIQKPRGDIQVNEIQGEAAIEEHQCCKESEIPKRDSNGVGLHQIKEMNNVQENETSENIIGLSQDIDVESDSMEILQDEKKNEQIGSNEIIPGKPNYANIIDKVDQDIEGHLRNIKVEMNENTTEETSHTGIPEIGAIINKKIENPSFEDSGSCSRKQDPEIDKESSMLIEAKISSEETQTSVGEKGSVIKEQQHSSEKNYQYKIEHDLATHAIKELTNEQRNEKSVNKMKTVDEDMYAALYNSEAQTEEYGRIFDDKDVAEESLVHHEATTSSEETQISGAEKEAVIKEHIEYSETNDQTKIEHDVHSHQVGLEIEQRTEHNKNEMELVDEDMYAASNSSEAQTMESYNRKEGIEIAEDSSMLTEAITPIEETQISEVENGVMEEEEQLASSGKYMYAASNSSEVQIMESYSRKEGEEIAEDSSTLTEAKIPIEETQIGEVKREAAIEEQLQSAAKDDQNVIKNVEPLHEVEGLEIEQRKENSAKKMEKDDEESRDVYVASNNIKTQIEESSNGIEDQEFAEEYTDHKEAQTASEETQISKVKKVVTEEPQSLETHDQDKKEHNVPSQVVGFQIEKRTENFENKMEHVIEDIFAASKGQEIDEESSMLTQAKTSSEETQINEVEKAVILKQLHCSETNYQNMLEHDVPLQEVTRLTMEQTTAKYGNNIEKVNEDMYIVLNNSDTQTDESCSKKEDQDIAEESTVLKEAKTLIEETQISEAEKEADIEEQLQSSSQTHDQNIIEHGVPSLEIGLEIDQRIESYENNMENIYQDMYAASKGREVPTVESGNTENSSTLTEAKTNEESQVNEVEKEAVVQEQLHSSESNSQITIEHDIPKEEMTKSKNEKSTENYENMEKIDEDNYVASNSETETQDSYSRNEDQEFAEELPALEEDKTSSEETQISEVEKAAVIEEQLQDIETNNQNKIEHDVPSLEVVLEIEQKIANSENRKDNIDEELYAALNSREVQTVEYCRKIGQETTNDSFIFLKENTVSVEAQTNKVEEAMIQEQHSSETNYQNEIKCNVPLQEVIESKIEQSIKNCGSKMEKLNEESQDVYAVSNNNNEAQNRIEDQETAEESPILKEAKALSEETHISEAQEEAVIELQISETNYQNKIEHDISSQERLDIEQRTENFENKMEYTEQDMYAASNRSDVQTVEPCSRNELQEIAEDSSTLTEEKNSSEKYQINEVGEVVIQELHNSVTDYQNTIERDVPIQEITRLEIEQSTKNSNNTMEKVDEVKYAASNNSEPQTEEYCSRQEDQEMGEGEETEISEAQKDAVIEEQVQSSETKFQNKIDDVPSREVVSKSEQVTENSESKMENVDEDVYAASKKCEQEAEASCSRKEDQEIAEKSPVLKETKNSSEESPINEDEIVVIKEQLQNSKTNYQNKIEHDVPSYEVGLEIKPRTENSENKDTASNRSEVQTEESYRTTEVQEVAKVSSMLTKAKTSSEEVHINEEKEVIQEKPNSSEINHQNQIEHDVPLQEVKGLEIEQSTENTENKLEKIDEDLCSSTKGSEAQVEESCSRKDQEITKESSILTVAKTFSEETIISEAEQEAVIEKHDVPSHEVGLEIEQRTENSANKMEKVDEDMDAASKSSGTQELTKAKTSSEETQITKAEKNAGIKDQLHSLERNYQYNTEQDVAPHEVEFETELRTETKSKMANVDEDKNASSMNNQEQTEISHGIEKGEEIAEASGAITKAKISSEETKISDVEKDAVIEKLYEVELEIGQRSENDEYKKDNVDEDLYAASNNSKSQREESCSRKEEQDIVNSSEAKILNEETQITEVEKVVNEDQLHTTETKYQNKIEHDTTSHDVGMGIEQTENNGNKIENVDEVLYVESISSEAQIKGESSLFTKIKASCEQTQISEVQKDAVIEKLHSSEINDLTSHEVELEIEQRTENDNYKKENVDEVVYAASNNSEQQSEEYCSRKEEQEIVDFSKAITLKEETQISEVEKVVTEDKLHTTETKDQNKIDHDVTSRDVGMGTKQRIENNGNKIENVDEVLYAASISSETQIEESSLFTKTKASCEETQISEVKKDAVLEEQLHVADTNDENKIEHDYPSLEVKEIKERTESSWNKTKKVDQEFYAASNSGKEQTEKSCNGNEDHEISEESSTLAEVKTSSEETLVNEVEIKAVIQEQLHISETNDRNNTEHDVPLHEVTELEIEQKIVNFENKEEKVDEDMYAESNYSEARKDENIDEHEVHETENVNHEKLVNQSSTETASCTGRQAQESTKASTTLSEVDVLMSSKYECTKTSYDKAPDGEFGENAKTGKQQSEEEPDRITIESDVPPYDDREPETNKKNDDKVVKGVNQEKIVDSDSIESQKVDAMNEQIGSNDYETGINTSEDMVNQRPTKSDSHSDKHEEQIILTTKHTEAQSPIESKDHSTLSSENVFQCKEESALDTADLDVLVYEVKEEEIAPQKEHFTSIVDVDQDIYEPSDNCNIQYDEETNDTKDSNESKGAQVVNNLVIVHQSYKENDSCTGKRVHDMREEFIPLTETPKHGSTDECANTAGKEVAVVKVKEDANSDKEICISDNRDPEEIKYDISSHEVKWLQFAQENEESLNTMAKLDQNIKEKSHSIEEKQEEKTNEQTTEATNKEEVIEASLITTEAENTVPSKDEYTSVASEKTEVGEVDNAALCEEQQCNMESKEQQCNMESKDQSSIEIETSSYEDKSLEIEQQTEISSNKIEVNQGTNSRTDRIEEQKDYKTHEIHETDTANKKQSHEECYFCIAKQDQETGVMSRPLSEANMPIPSNDEVNWTSMYEIQLSQVREEGLSKNEDPNNSNNEDFSIMEEVDQGIKVQMDSNGGKKDNEAQETGSREIYKLMAIKDDETVNQSSKDLDSSQGKHNQENSDTSTLTTKAEFSIPSTFECTRNSGENFQAREVEDVGNQKLQCSIGANDQNKIEDVQFCEARGVEIERNGHEMTTVEDLTQGKDAESNNVEEHKDGTKTVSYENIVNQPLKVDGDETGKIKAVDQDSGGNASRELCEKELVTDQDFLDATHEAKSSETRISHINCENAKEVTDDTQKKDIRQANEPCDQQQEPSSMYLEQKDVVIRNNGRDESSKKVDIVKEEEQDTIPGVDLQQTPAEKYIVNQSPMPALIPQGDNSSYQIKTNRESVIYTDSSLETNRFEHIAKQQEKECTNSEDSDAEKHHNDQLNMDEHQDKDNLAECKVEVCDTMSEVDSKSSISHDSRISEIEATTMIFEQALTEAKIDTSEKPMNSMENTCERPSEKIDYMQGDKKTNELNLEAAHRDVKGDKEEALEVRTNVNFPETNDTEIFPPKVEEENLFAKDSEDIAGIAELHQDSRDMRSRIDASQSTENMEFNDAKREIEIPDLKDVHINIQDNETNTITNMSREKETDEKIKTQSFPYFQEMHRTTKSIAKLERKPLEDTSTENLVQEACLETLELQELEVPNLKDKPTENLLPKELAEEIISSTSTIPVAEKSKMTNFEAQAARDNVEYEDKKTLQEKQSHYEVKKLIMGDAGETNSEVCASTEAERDVEVNEQKQTEHKDSKEIDHTEYMRELDYDAMGAKDQEKSIGDNHKENSVTNLGTKQVVDHSVETKDIAAETREENEELKSIIIGKPRDKKSHNILAGVISKVKKAITCSSGSQFAPSEDEIIKVNKTKST